MNAAVGADERLVVMLEARITEFEKRMRRAEGQGTRSFQNLRRGSRAATQQMERDMIRSTTRINQALATTSTRIGVFAKSFAGGLLQGGVVAAAGALTAGAISRTVKGIAQIGDEAKRAGVGLEAFQEWKFVAEQNRIGVDQMVDGLKELNLRADEFVTTGKGAAAEAFQRLGFSAASLSEGLKDPSELLLEIMGRLQGLDRAAQIRVADEIFGGSAGERFVELIGQGEAGLRRTIDRAHEVGAVMDSEMVDKAAELDRKFQELSTRVGTFFKGLAVGAAEAAGNIAGIMVEVQRAQELFDNPDMANALIGAGLVTTLNQTEGAVRDNVAVIVDLTLEYERLSRAAAELSPELMVFAGQLGRVGQSDAADELNAIARAVDDLGGQLDRGEVKSDAFEKEMAELLTRAKEVFSSLGDVDAAGFSGVIGRLGDLQAELAAARDRANELRAALPADAVSLPLAPSDGSSIDPPFTPDSSAPTTRPRAPGVDSFGDWQNSSRPSSRGGGGGGRSVDDYAKAAEAIREETRALEAQAVALIAVAEGGANYANAVEYARRRAELLNAAMKDGKAVTPELTAEIEALARGYDAASEAARSAEENMRKVQDASERGAEAMTDVFMSVLDGSKSARQAVADLLMQMARVQMQKAMMGLAGSSGAVGGFFRGLGQLLSFDGGGYTGSAPRSGGLDGKGGFMAMLHPRETVVDHTKSGGSSRASDPVKVDVAVHLSPDLEGRILEQAGQQSARISERVVMAYDREMPNRVQAINANPRRR